jgi:hypothetical protein
MTSLRVLHLDSDSDRPRNGFEWMDGVLRNWEVGIFQLQFLQISERVSHFYRHFSRRPQEYKRPYNENIYKHYWCIILCRCRFISFIASCLFTIWFYQLRWPRDNLCPVKLALTSPRSGGRLVSIVRLRTQATEFVLFVDSLSSKLIHIPHIQYLRFCENYFIDLEFIHWKK